MSAMRRTWQQSRQFCKVGYCQGGGNARKRNQVHFAIVSLGDKTAKQGRQDAEVSIFVKKAEMAEALPLVLTSSLAVVVSREVNWKFFDKVVTHTEPPASALGFCIRLSRIPGRLQR